MLGNRAGAMHLGRDGGRGRDSIQTPWSSLLGSLFLLGKSPDMKLWVLSIQEHEPFPSKHPPSATAGADAEGQRHVGQGADPDNTQLAPPAGQVGASRGVSLV